MRAAGLRAVPSREAMTVPEQGYERAEIAPFIQLQDQPRWSDEQGVGKTPGLYAWPWSRVFQSLVDKKAKQGAGWPNFRNSPPRPEQHGWGTQYLLYFEQRNRHVWPAGWGNPQTVIEHPETVPWVSLAPRL